MFGKYDLFFEDDDNMTDFDEYSIGSEKLFESEYDAVFRRNKILSDRNYEM